MDYRNQDPFITRTGEDEASYDMGLRSYMLGVYNYMASALALTGIFSYLAAHWAPMTNALFAMSEGHMGLSGLGWLVLLAPLGFVLFLSFGINRMSAATAQGVFWAYAAVNGMALAPIFFVYTGQSIVRVFFITAIVFGSMSIWGYTTKKDLTGMGHFMMMGIWGIILASLLNLFFHSSGLQFAVSILAVIIFTGLTAYDTQAIKAIYYQTMNDGEAAAKSAVMGALRLYLDFINIFLQLLQFFGDRRN